MQENTDNNKVKTVRKCVRLTKDMDRLFSIVAKDHNTTVGKYLRDSGLILAEISVDEKQFLQQVSAEDKMIVQKKFELIFQEIKDLVVNSSAGLYDTLRARIDRLERLTELFLYAFLFHTPEVPEHKKEEAVQSAKKRKRKVLELVEQLLQEAKEGKDGT
jgi:hypothetical protein